MLKRFNGESVMEIKPIKTDTDYQSALNDIENLFDAAPGTPDGDRLEVLTTLVDAYEEQNHPIPLPDPIEAIKYYMESRRLSRRDLERYIGNGEKVDNILDRKVALTIDMIRKLHSRLGISADILIQPYSLK